MELQLGLALPVHSTTSPKMVKGLDLNDQIRFEPNELISYGWESKSHGTAKSKRSFEEAFGIKIGDEANNNNNYMPNLLVWDGQPNEEDDRKKGHDNHYINQ